MPELPDVEIFKRYVDSTSLHQKMTGSLAYFKNPDDEPPHSNKGSTFEVLTLDGGDTLPVFSGEGEAELFLWLREAREYGWEVHESSAEDLASVLSGPRSRVGLVTPDPSTEIFDGQRGEEVEVAKQDYEQKYTHPELREQIKEEIKASDKGGKEGQWSARKSQLLTQEYEKQGGGYKGEKDQSQKNLEKWTEEEWQTSEGGADARQDGETKRYLPRKAWENMSEEEKEETERKKREGSKKG